MKENPFPGPGFEPRTIPTLAFAIPTSSYKILHRYTYLFSIDFMYISVAMHGSSGDLGSLCSILLTYIRAGYVGLDSVNL